MRFDIITIFPQIFDSYFGESLIKRAIGKKIIKVKAHNLRDYSLDRHNKVDDRPYGGGPGMVMAVKPIYRATQFLKSKVSAKGGSASGGKSPKLKTRTILFSTRGKKLDAKTAKRLSKYDSLILICGRYEGVDERVAKYIADEEISIGNYVLNGGELAAMVLMETVSRFLPGFLGKMESLEEIKGSYAAYTRPAEFVPKKGIKPWRVPKVLLSGHHYKIKEFRK
ncbi:MAG: tRNA (guanosine(37)-N1)-methyltransferase TrmD [Candidatus Liptonbacteria bacterium RIFCSPLOWO2_01_FULL_45_15]|uniref:tRNA (guanine-N(1)-)-methyltransferase n=1 Tax=Candidatus Liptonbacteria bacterium RIFCSPLOWO2_01_FULL_45_15 TaxID=1798649 RepID=A0A1G2CIW1_9BACT|nr:MAG: tRNA (guanosine(37)-N1)-methyltransferase TrmD [Candidatus Liptonbacteria bacterium RIFCSPLOWO2_01_FULL_45_15]